MLLGQRDDVVVTSRPPPSRARDLSGTCSNKWVNNIGSMPKLEWNPETPLHQTSLWYVPVAACSSPDMHILSYRLFARMACTNVCPHGPHQHLVCAAWVQGVCAECLR